MTANLRDTSPAKLYMVRIHERADLARFCNKENEWTKIGPIYKICGSAAILFLIRSIIFLPGATPIDWLEKKNCSVKFDF